MKKKLLILLSLILAHVALHAATEAASTTTSATQKEAAPLITVEDFFKNPTKFSFRISPKGDYLAYLAPWNTRMNIFVQKIGSPDAIRITSATERDINSFIWVNNQKIVYLQDNKGDENYHLYVIDRDGSNFKSLTPFEGVRVGIVDDLIEADRENEILIKMNKEDPHYFDVYNANIATGELKLIEKNPGNIQGWVTDHKGDIRMAIESDGVNEKILYRHSPKDPWKEIINTDFREAFSPIVFTPDNQHIYAATNIGRDKDVIIEYDPETQKEIEVIYQHPTVDVDGASYSIKKKKLVGVSFIEDKQQLVYFDEDRKKMQTWLESKLPGVQIFPTSTNLEEDKFIIATFSDTKPGVYYFYDNDKQSLEKIAETYPWLPTDQLASTQPITFQARDGLMLHGYLTLPKGVDPKNLPFIINPHGGPWTRDAWGYNPITQLFANRGYGVLQINYRGSTGYGRAFWEKGFKEWGKAMQNDLSDGVAWLIKQGYANPKHIGIFGGSYGGYAVLAGLAFTPELYACGIDIVGPSNIFTLLESLPPYWETGRQKLYAMIGDPEKDKQLLKEVSPLFHVQNIKAPLLIVQGANDPRVKQRESDQIVEELKKRNIDVQYILNENEGHGFHNEENQIQLYKDIEIFLNKHLGGRKTTTTAAANATTTPATTATATTATAESTDTTVPESKH